MAWKYKKNKLFACSYVYIGKTHTHTNAGFFFCAHKERAEEFTKLRALETYPDARIKDLMVLTREVPLDLLEGKIYND